MDIKSEKSDKNIEL